MKSMFLNKVEVFLEGFENLTESLVLTLLYKVRTQNLKKNLLHGFYKSADLLSKHQNHDEGFFKLCVLLKMSKLYFIKFGHSEKGTKFEKIFHLKFDATE